jgi:predicted membrane GTPase involved in stress response
LLRYITIIINNNNNNHYCYYYLIGNDDALKLVPALELNLDIAVEYIAEDELVEVTPTKVVLMMMVIIIMIRMMKNNLSYLSKIDEGDDVLSPFLSSLS